MRTGWRLAAFGAGLGLVFAGAFTVAGAIVPASSVAAWQQRSTGEPHGEAPDQHGEAPDQHGGDPGGHGGQGQSGQHGSGSNEVRGLSLDQDGYRLSPVSAPRVAGRAGALAFRVLDGDGHAVTDFAVEHEKRLHLIVVRADGAEFRHVHPTMAADGTWSIDWRWSSAGSYRVLADFVPTGPDAPKVTLARTVDVAGVLAPRSAAPVRTTARVDGFDVRLQGHLHAGEATELTVEVTRAGRPVTTLQPYLGAFGHLVALREGDLAYLHVHAEGVEPVPGDTAGPAVTFVSTAPTPGRYLLYLDFRVDGVVRTATFVVEAS